MAVSKTILKTTREFRVNTDEEAKKLIAEESELAIQNGYSVIKASYDYKEKKSKGEVIDSGFLVKITYHFSNFWE